MNRNILEVKKEINENSGLVFGKKLDEFKKNFEQSNRIVKRDMQNLQKTLVSQ